MAHNFVRLKEWVDGCYSWIENELHLDPATDMDAIINNVDAQLLQSDLTDSMVHGTGLPHNVSELSTPLRGPVLVQIVSITEIGHSAFSLQNTRQARIERADLAGLAAEEGEDDDEGPIPKYPRSMLRFQLSDGATILQAIEFRRLPELELGETPLGYKMILKDVTMRRGMAFLEPKSVIMKGYMNAELNAMQDTDFVRGLRLRLGKPEDDPADHAPPEGPPPATHRNLSPPLAVSRSTQGLPPQLPAALVRSPLRDISPPPSPPAAGPSGTSHDDDEGQPRRRKVPNRLGRTPSPEPPPRNRRQQPVHSHYFAGSTTSNAAAVLAGENLFSPHRQAPIFVLDSDEEDGGVPAPGTTVIGSGKQKDKQPEADTSSEYAFESDLGDEILEQADRLEREALQCTQATDATLVETTKTQGTAESTAGLSSSRGSGSRAGLSSSSTGESRNARAAATVIDVDEDVISISGDEDDKENVPAPTRHVRRRMRAIIDESDIMEISD
ncbi:RecQ-mediated genome instability protein 1 [Grifola frondosa]|uniref:RecQ-mediated genome instability protein 1 n=1 Tax=Grifola frondosa TaxID=5627 RepID=A0A1C7M5P1_GRIFR|nr:RecQ-mediated genome instability protein 1 [Grifola frondosa]